MIVSAYQVATTGHCQQGQREQIRYDKIKYYESQFCKPFLKNVLRGFLQFLNLLSKINHAVVQVSSKADVPRSSPWMRSCHAWCRTVLQYMCLNMGVQLIFKHGASVPGRSGQLHVLKGPNPIKQMGCFETDPKRSSRSGLAFESQPHASTSPRTINITSYLMISFSRTD